MGDSDVGRDGGVAGLGGVTLKNLTDLIRGKHRLVEI